MSDSQRESVDQFLDQHAKPWSRERWIRIKEELRDCVWVEGAVLAHTDKDRIYFAPEPTQFGLIYEIRKTDIKEALPTGNTRSKLGDDYEIVRIYIHKDAILVRMEWCLASKLPSVMESLKVEATAAEDARAGAPLTVWVESPNGKGGKGGGGGASPSPEPKGGGGGTGASGVRG